MADWSLPILSSLYTEFHDTLKARDNDAIIWLDGVTSTNLPDGAKRWNSISSIFEKFNGTAWSPLTAKYMINVDQIDGCTVNDAGATTSDLWTGSKITAGLATKVDTSTYTPADVLDKLLTVDGAGSGLDADFLDGQSSDYYNNGNNIAWSTSPIADKFHTGVTTPITGNILNYSGVLRPFSISLITASATTDASVWFPVTTAADSGIIKLKTLANIKLEIGTNLTLSGTPTAPTAPAGTNSTQVATTAFVNTALAPAAVPAGAVITFASSSAPAGYMKANGAAVSRTTYSELFAAIGTTFGIGDGSTTFNLPDLRGYFQRGWDDARGIDTGRVFGSTQEDAYENHSHTATSNSTGAHTHGILGGNTNTGTTRAGTSANTTYTINSNSAGAHSHTITVGLSTTGGTETRPKNIALLYCIKY